MCIIAFYFTDVVVLTIRQAQVCIRARTVVHGHTARTQKTSAAYIFRPRNYVDAPSGSVDAGQPNRYPQLNPHFRSAFLSVPLQ